MEIRLASKILSDSVVDGEGLRTVIWTQGCPHHCKQCHNPETWSFEGGFLKDCDEVIEEIKNIELQDGVTFSGGDPMMQPEACMYIAKELKKLGLNIWCYTGFKFEELNDKQKEFLKYVDVLVDGEFMIDLKSYSAKFRGSTNQRVLNVKSSLKNNKPVCLKKYK